MPEEDSNSCKNEEESGFGTTNEGDLEDQTEEQATPSSNDRNIDRDAIVVVNEEEVEDRNLKWPFLMYDMPTIMVEDDNNDNGGKRNGE